MKQPTIQYNIPRTMRAVAIDAIGQPETVRELPTPQISPGEFLVRVRAAGINPIDWKIRDGIVPVGNVHFPLVLGQDAAGEVVQIGSAVKQFSLGEEVYGIFRLAGALAEYVKGSESSVVARKPTKADFAHAAALPTAGVTALDVVNFIQPSQGNRILVVGATGGVGSYVVQLAAHWGAHIIATATEESKAYIQKLGAAEIIDHTRTDVASAVKKAHPDGVDAVVDLVNSGKALARLAGTLRKGGRLASTIHAVNDESVGRHDIEARNVDMEASSKKLEELTRLVDSDVITIPLSQTFPLDEAPRALDERKSGHVRGKIVLLVA